MSTESTRSWLSEFNHPKAWMAAPAGCLMGFGALLLVGAILVMALMTTVLPGYRSTASYQAVFDTINAHPTAVGHLGTPIRETGLISDVSNHDAGDGFLRRRLVLRVAGPLGEATLFSVIVESEEDARLHVLRLTLTDGTRVVIHGRNTGATL